MENYEKREGRVGSWEAHLGLLIGTCSSLMVNFMCEIDWATDCPGLIKYYFCECLRGCPQKRLAFQLVSPVEQMAIPIVVGIDKSTEVLK